MNFFAQNLKRLSLYFIVSTLILDPILTANNVKEAEYVWPIDEDNVIPLPIASLRGKLMYQFSKEDWIQVISPGSASLRISFAYKASKAIA